MTTLGGTCTELRGQSNLPVVTAPVSFWMAGGGGNSETNERHPGDGERKIDL